MARPSNPSQLLAKSAQRSEKPDVNDLHVEIARLKQQVRHVQRLASLGTTAATLAHEINNLMTPILGYAQFALSRDDLALKNKALQSTVSQIDSVLAMTHRILNMSADEPVAFESVPIAHVIHDAIGSLCRDLGKDGITLTVDVSDDLIVRAHPKHLQQVFFNLLLNARDALHSRPGQVIIRSQRTDDKKFSVSVSDTGDGIPPDVLPSIFDEFFTTKSNGHPSRKKGSGLGLSICKDIIEEHGGTIDVQSKPGQGTTFILTLPQGD